MLSDGYFDICMIWLQRYCIGIWYIMAKSPESVKDPILPLALKFVGGVGGLLEKSLSSYEKFLKPLLENSISSKNLLSVPDTALHAVSRLLKIHTVVPAIFHFVSGDTAKGCLSIAATASLLGIDTLIGSYTGQGVSSKEFWLDSNYNIQTKIFRWYISNSVGGDSSFGGRITKWIKDGIKHSVKSMLPAPYYGYKSVAEFIVVLDAIDGLSSESQFERIVSATCVLNTSIDTLIALKHVFDHRDWFYKTSVALYKVSIGSSISSEKSHSKHDIAPQNDTADNSFGYSGESYIPCGQNDIAPQNDTSDNKVGHGSEYHAQDYDITMELHAPEAQLLSALG